jgi:hypothetical protein
MTRRLLAMSILTCLAGACSQDEATVSYVIRQPDPDVVVTRLDDYAIFDGQPGSGGGSQTDPQGIDFPVVGSVGWFDEQASSGATVQICAIGQSEDGLFAAVSDPVTLIVNETVEVSLELAASEETPEPCQLP